MSALQRGTSGEPHLASDGRPLGVFGGLTTLDVVHRSAHAPGRNEKVTASRQDVSAGGPAANAAVVFSALGGHARLVTALGSGAVARIARDDLERHGVEVVDLTPDSDAELGVSAVRVDEATGERSVLSLDGAARTIAVDRVVLADRARDLVAGAQIVLLDGHHPALARALVDAARERLVPVVVDAGRWRPVMGELLPAASTIIASADFRWHGVASTTAGVAAPWADLEHAQQVVTHGADPVEWWWAGGSGVVAVPSVRTVDTLGAGDAFHGAFAYHAMLHAGGTGGADLPSVLAAAAEVAALRCSVVGPRDWLQLVTRAGAERA